MKYSIDQLDSQLKHYTELLRKSKLLPNPNREWQRGTREYEQKVIDLTMAVTILKFLHEKIEENRKIAELYKKLNHRDQTGTAP